MSHAELLEPDLESPAKPNPQRGQLDTVITANSIRLGTTDEWEKKLRFREHLAWAVDHGAAGDIIAILDKMDECDWLHKVD